MIQKIKDLWFIFTTAALGILWWVFQRKGAELNKLKAKVRRDKLKTRMVELDKELENAEKISEKKLRSFSKRYNANRKLYERLKL